MHLHVVPRKLQSRIEMRVTIDAHEPSFDGYTGASEWSQGTEISYNLKIRRRAREARYTKPQFQSVSDNQVSQS